jgi:hypothetical protein
VAARFESFPSSGQPSGTPPWPQGRFTGDCAADGDLYLCFYEDEQGRQGYVCFAAAPELEVVDAAGAEDSRRRFDHDGRALPPDGRCART